MDGSASDTDVFGDSEEEEARVRDQSSVPCASSLVPCIDIPSHAFPRLTRPNVLNSHQLIEDREPPLPVADHPGKRPAREAQGAHGQAVKAPR